MLLWLGLNSGLGISTLDLAAFEKHYEQSNNSKLKSWSGSRLKPLGERLTPGGSLAVWVPCRTASVLQNPAGWDEESSWNTLVLSRLAWDDFYISEWPLAHSRHLQPTT